MMRNLMAAAACALIALASAASAQPVGEAVTEEFRRALPNVPGKEMSSLLVKYAPGGKSEPHRHGDASVYAYVLSGAVRSQLAGEPARVYRAGEGWFEPPSSRHIVSENASATEPASLLAVFVAPAGAQLKVPDSPAGKPK